MDADSELRKIWTKTSRPAMAALVIGLGLALWFGFMAWTGWVRSNRMKTMFPGPQPPFITEMIESNDQMLKTLAALFAIASLAWIVAVPLVVRALVRKKRIALYAAANRCTECGYLLSGSETGDCSECGAADKHIREQGRSVKSAGKKRLYIIDGRCAWCTNSLPDPNCLECPNCGAWRPENWTDVASSRPKAHK